MDKWELSRPIEEGFGRLEFGSRDILNDEPGFYTADLQRVRSGPAPPDDGHRPSEPGGEERGFLHARPLDRSELRDGARPEGGYGLFEDIGRYEFWKFDLEHRKLAGRMEFKGRPRMGLKTSSNGKVLYIYVAGNTIDLYDAETYQYLRTITIDGDQTTELFVLPDPRPRSRRAAQVSDELQASKAKPEVRKADLRLQTSDFRLLEVAGSPTDHV